MSWTQISDNYWVSPQISVEDVATAAAEGFTAIVCNRPDGESADQIDSATIEAAAKAHGLKYEFLPMNGPVYTEAYVQTVKGLIASNDKVLAYCRSGNRSSILFNAALA